MDSVLLGQSTGFSIQAAPPSPFQEGQVSQALLEMLSDRYAVWAEQYAAKDPSGANATTQERLAASGQVSSISFRLAGQNATLIRKDLETAESLFLGFLARPTAEIRPLADFVSLEQVRGWFRDLFAAVSPSLTNTGNVLIAVGISMAFKSGGLGVKPGLGFLPPAWLCRSWAGLMRRNRLLRRSLRSPQAMKF